MSWKRGLLEKRDRPSARDRHTERSRAGLPGAALGILFVCLLASCQQKQVEEERAVPGTAADTMQGGQMDTSMTSPSGADTAAAPAETSMTSEATSPSQETAAAPQETPEEQPAAPEPEKPKETAEKPAEKSQPAAPSPSEQPAKEEVASADTPPGAQEAKPEQQPQEGQQAEGGEKGSMVVSPQVYQGWKQFAANCERCHGQDALGSALAPDLRRSLTESSVAGGGPLSHDAFVGTVVGGRPAKGMPTWSGILSSEQIEAIYAYLMARASGKLPAGRPTPKEGS